ncbi:MAG TPA: MYXO-CTERM sorting domain-containing protein, partial [Polyangiaceae bacterium]
PSPDQASANDFISLVNWPDGHADAFARTTSGDLVQTSSQTGDTWSAPVTLAAGVECGSTADYWPHVLPWPTQAEVVSPRSGGGAGHLGWTSGAWTASSPLGTLSLSHFQSVTHFDGNLEVFALGADGAIHANGGDRWKSTWSDWHSLGGSFRTGPSAIVWNDGHTELFAIGTDGKPQHAWTKAGVWQSWAPMQGDLLSRPIPVRWPDGHVEVFATGSDDKLQHASSTGVDWSAFADVDATTDILGDPSAIMNETTPRGAEVFARAANGQVVHLRWDGAKYPAFAPVLAQTTVADPMGWVRKDGTAEVFAVDANHALVHSQHDGAVWSAWAAIGAGVDACVPKPIANPPPPPPGADAGGLAVPGDTAPAAEDGGCACSVPAGGNTSSALGAFVAALGLVVARARRSRRIHGEESEVS